MRKVFRRRRPSATLGPCMTSLIHSSPASRKANRRRSVATGSPGRLSSRPSRESRRCTVEGASGWSTPRSRAAPMRVLTDGAGCSVLSETSSSATSGGRRRGWPRSARKGPPPHSSPCAPTPPRPPRSGRSCAPGPNRRTRCETHAAWCRTRRVRGGSTALPRQAGGPSRPRGTPEHRPSPGRACAPRRGSPSRVRTAGPGACASPSSARPVSSRFGRRGQSRSTSRPVPRSSAWRSAP